MDRRQGSKTKPGQSSISTIAMEKENSTVSETEARNSVIVFCRSSYPADSPSERLTSTYMDWCSQKSCSGHDIWNNANRLVHPRYFPTRRENASGAPVAFSVLTLTSSTNAIVKVISRTAHEHSIRTTV